MHIEDRLRAIIDVLPQGSMVTVSVDWIRASLDTGPCKGDLDEQARDLTVAEVAEVVGRKESTIRTWLGREQIPEAYHLNNRDWRIPRAALQRYLERQRNGYKGKIGIPAENTADLSDWRAYSK